MSPNGGDNNFSDDDFDDLPNDYLAELEHNAIQFTQAQTQPRVLKQPAAVNAAPSSDYGDDIDDEDLDDAVVIDESRSTPAIIPNLQREHTSQAVQREQFRQQRYGNATAGNAYANNGADRERSRMPPPPMFSQPIPQGSRTRKPENDSSNTFGSQPAASQHGADALQKQIEDLLKERDALKSDLNAKTGEIAIVRSKQEKTVKQYEREMLAMRKLNEEKISKQEKALEAAKTAEKNAATERDFLKQDLAEESERVRKLNKAETSEKLGANLTTPKKKKALAHRDGFDDEEIEFLSPSKVSPSKFQKRLMGSPSKAGAKRKRKAVESPIAALEVMQDDTAAGAADVAEGRDFILDESILAGLSMQDDRFDFLGTMLDHKVDSQHQRTIQELEKYALPSAPKESFETYLLSKIPQLGLKKDQKSLPIDFCELLVSMWTKCMDDKYLAPIYLLVDLLTTALEMKTSAIAPSLTDSIVPLAQLTADLVVIPRWKGKSAEIHEKHVDVGKCLELLQIVSLGCMGEQQHIVRFWKLMRFDFVLVMLSPNQPTIDFETMMRLLSTSVFAESFGPIVAESTQAVQVMDNILDRLTYTLFEVPPLPQTSEKMDLAVLSRLRFKVLLLMTSMTQSPFASKAIAMHPHAIGRLVSLISDELDDLYDYRARHKEGSRIITLATRLLYHLVTRFDDDNDMQKKLAVIRGGSQKYLLALSRLNFSEDDLLLESSIDTDVAACALELLELFVTPEEGDAIHSAFSAGS